MPRKAKRGAAKAKGASKSIEKAEKPCSSAAPAAQPSTDPTPQELRKRLEELEVRCSSSSSLRV